MILAVVRREKEYILVEPWLILGAAVAVRKHLGGWVYLSMVSKVGEKIRHRGRAVVFVNDGIM